MSTPKSLAERAIGAIADHLAQGDWGNAERVLNAYTADHTCTCYPHPSDHEDHCPQRANGAAR